MTNYIFFTVFLSGLVTLGVELAASRLIEPFFGSSLLIWSSLIGFVLGAMSIGYYIGGRLVDRTQSHAVLFRIVLGGGAFIGFIPWIVRTILLQSLRGFDQGSMFLIVGSLVAALFIICLPMLLLGMVSPFAIRILTPSTAVSGSYAGKIFAVGTIGSIAGAFLPALVLIPLLGTRGTFAAFSCSLIFCGLVGIALTRRSSFRPVLSVSLLLIAAVFSLAFDSSPLRPSVQLLLEKETSYNYIQVTEQNGVRQLELSDGRGVHSIYSPHGLPFGTYWDLLLAATLFSNEPPGEFSEPSLLMVGAAAGTSARRFQDAFGALRVVGVEIDPEISRIGREYFGMTQKNLETINSDGRVYLNYSKEKFSVIAVDAYRPPYIPFHLTTREFLHSAKEHLLPAGIVAVNAWRTRTDNSLVLALANTMKSEFASVFALEGNFGGEFDNTILIGTPEKVTKEQLFLNMSQVSSPLLQRIALLMRNSRVWEITCDTDAAFRPIIGDLPHALPKVCAEPFTDDWAPIENLTHGMMFNFLRGD